MPPTPSTSESTTSIQSQEQHSKEELLFLEAEAVRRHEEFRDRVRVVKLWLDGLISQRRRLISQRRLKRSSPQQMASPQKKR